MTFSNFLPPLTFDCSYAHDKKETHLGRKKNRVRAGLVCNTESYLAVVNSLTSVKCVLYMCWFLFTFLLYILLLTAIYHASLFCSLPIPPYAPVYISCQSVSLTLSSPISIPLVFSSNRCFWIGSNSFRCSPQCCLCSVRSDSTSEDTQEEENWRGRNRSTQRFNFSFHGNFSG